MDNWTGDSLLINLIVIGLAALLHATLQLGLGCAILLYHGSVGRRHVQARTNTLVSSFIAGVGLAALALLAAICFFIVDIGVLNGWATAVVVGVLIGAGTFTFGFYYRRGSQATELWLPRRVARFLDERAHKTNNNTEAYLLGTMSCFGELPFSLPLLLLAANATLQLPQEWQLLAVAGYVILVTLPLAAFRLAIRNSIDLSVVQKWRRGRKNFLKLVAASGYLVLAAFVFVFMVLGVR